MQVVSDFVNRGDFNVEWHLLAFELVEPLDIASYIDAAQFPAFARQAEAGIRAEWPESYNNRELWRSRTGPWCRDSGVRRILEIVEKTAMRMRDSNA